jgi:hypothetical protein
MGIADLLGQFKGRIADVDVADGQVKEMQNTIEMLQGELRKAQCLNPDAALIEDYEQQLREKDRQIAELQQFKMRCCACAVEDVLERYGMEVATQLVLKSRGG